MPTPVFLYPDPKKDFVDSRPCFNAAGDTVVFMRQDSKDSPASLWTVNVTSNGTGTPKQLFPHVSPTKMNEATRPDWSWVDDQKIAFSGTHNGKTGLFLLDADGTNPHHIEVTDGGGVVSGDNISYPSWYPHGKFLAVTDYGPNRLLKVDATTGAATPLTDPEWILTGQSSVNQTSSDHVCAAAQLVCCPAPKKQLGCRECGADKNYDQTKNHVWIQKDPSTERPHCIQVTGHGYGRAPWWSPDGKTIAFESDYNTSDGNYAIYIYRRSDQSLAAITPLDNWNCSHAKFDSSASTRLVVAATHKGVRSGIAIVDF